MEYFYEELSNGLKIFVVNDPDSNESSAVMYVGVGSNDNPSDLDGLAHYLEHMLFMGSDKYPGNTYFQSEVSANGGGTNAFTTDTYTQYYFNTTKNFMVLLEVFSRFFIKPMFEVEHVESEINAVDSEHKKNIGSDGWRMMNLSKEFFTDGVNNRFTTGTKETLLNSVNVKGDGVKLRDRLISFYEEYYSSDKMVLFLSLNEPNMNGTTVKKITKLFEDVPRREGRSDRIDNPVQKSPKMREYIDSFEYIEAKTVNDEHSVTINWILPGSSVFVDGVSNDAYDFLSYILNSTSQGSLYSLLKLTNVVIGVSAGIDKIFYDSCCFELQIRLAPDGVDSWDKIVYIVDGYIRHLLGVCTKSEKLFRSFYKERQNLAMLSLQILDKASGMQMCEYYADVYDRKRVDLRYVPISFCLLGVVDECRNKFCTYLEEMTLNRAKILIASSTINESKLNRTDRFYGTKYCHKVVKIDLSTQARINDVISHKCALTNTSVDVLNDDHIPKLNPYIEPLHKIDVIDPITKGDPSYRRISSANGNLFFLKNGNTFDTHTVFGVIQISLDCLAKHVREPSDLVRIIMYIRCINKLKEQDFQHLVRARLKIDVDVDSDGLMLIIDGYNNRRGIDSIFSTVLAWYFSEDVKIDEDTYAMVYTELMAGFQNYNLSDPYALVGSNFRECVNRHHTISNAKMIKALEKFHQDTMDPDNPRVKVQQDTLDLISNGRIVGVFGGSITVKQVDSIISALEKAVSTAKTPERRYNIPLADLTRKRTHIHANPNNTENAVGYGVYLGNVVEDGEEWKKIKPICAILDSFISEKFSATIRTERQIGYVAMSTVTNVNEADNNDMYLLFIVQSTRTDLDKIVETYVNHELLEDVSTLTNEDFEVMKHSMIAKLTEKPPNIRVECGDVLSAIKNTHDKDKFFNDETYIHQRFNRKQQMADQLQHITLDEFLKFITQKIKDNIVSIVRIDAYRDRYEGEYIDE